MYEDLSECLFQLGGAHGFVILYLGSVDGDMYVKRKLNAFSVVTQHSEVHFNQLTQHGQLVYELVL
jgi:hypothetical protein